MIRRVVVFDCIRSVCLIVASLVVLGFAGSSAEARNPRYMPIDEVRTAAMAGDPAAQYELGLRYEIGRDGVAQNYNGMKQWYEAAAKQGHVPAMFEMGMQHAMGRMTLDFDIAAAQSRHWFDALDAANVIVEDKYYIKRDHIERKNVADQKLRFEWLHRVSENGHPQAQRYLGYQYDLGAFSRDCLKAGRWFLKAAAQGDRYSQMKMGDAYAICDGLPIDLEKSTYWYREAALQGDVSAQISVSAAYRLGRGVATNDKLAAYWIGQAAEQGDAVAQKSLGDRYRDGASVPRDISIAMSWYEKSAAQDYDKGIAALAVLERQTGASPSPLEAAALLAAFWIVLDAVSDVTEPETEPSPHSPTIQKAIKECYSQVHRRIVRCYSSMTFPGCTMTGECTYEWTCQSGNKGRGKCRPGAKYTDEQVDYYCDPLVGKKYTTREPVYEESCH